MATITLKCRIADISEDEKHKGRMIVSVEFDDGNKKLGPWFQAFSLSPSKVLTLEELADQLYTKEIARPVDPYVLLRQAMEDKKSFVLELPSTGVPTQPIE